MNREEFIQAIAKALPQAHAAPDPHNPEAITIEPSAIHETAQWLRDDPASQLTYFEFITAQDYPQREEIVLIYSLYSYTLGHRLIFKANLSRQAPHAATVSDIWEGANWSEREVYDLYGVIFDHHPDLRRIMMFEGWEGYPLRKDYAHPNLIHRPE